MNGTKTSIQQEVEIDISGQIDAFIPAAKYCDRFC